MEFTALHHQNTPLLIANVWDACSASAAQQGGYQALGTSSAAIAAMLGYEDGQVMPFDELLFMVERIKAVSDLPLTVDIEAGFGDSADEIVSNIKRLATLGVVGINLEDSRVVNGVRRMENADIFATKLKQICQLMAEQTISMFINIRTDTFLLGIENALDETLNRAQLYTESGADGLFVPCIAQETDIEIVARKLTLPLNVMCMPELPDFKRLQQLGVRRISMGNFVHAQLQLRLKKLMASIQSQQSFVGVFHDESH